jgi:hypothetical protein
MLTLIVKGCFVVLVTASALAWEAELIEYRSISWAPDGRSFLFQATRRDRASGSSCPSLLKYDLETGVITNLMPRALKFLVDPTSKRLVFCDSLGIYLLWLDENGKVLRSPVQLHFEPLLSSESERFLLLGFSQDSLRFCYGVDRRWADLGIKHFEIALAKDPDEHDLKSAHQELDKVPEGAYNHLETGQSTLDELAPFSIAERRHPVDLLFTGSDGSATVVLPSCRLLSWYWSPDRTQVIAKIEREPPAYDHDQWHCDAVENGSTFFLLDAATGSSTRIADLRTFRSLGGNGDSDIVWLGGETAILRNGATLLQADLQARRVQQVALHAIPDWADWSPPKYLTEFVFEEIRVDMEATVQGGFTIQLAAGSSYNALVRLAEQLMTFGMSARIVISAGEATRLQEQGTPIPAAVGRGEVALRLRFGVFATREEAMATLERLESRTNLDGWIDKIELDAVSTFPFYGAAASDDGAWIAYLASTCQLCYYFTNEIRLVQTKTGARRTVVPAVANF